jgi:hypothetical protein
MCVLTNKGSLSTPLLPQHTNRLDAFPAGPEDGRHKWAWKLPAVRPELERPFSLPLREYFFRQSVNEQETRSRKRKRVLKGETKWPANRRMKSCTITTMMALIAVAF